MQTATCENSTPDAMNSLMCKTMVYTDEYVLNGFDPLSAT